MCPKSFRKHFVLVVKFQPEAESPQLVVSSTGSTGTGGQYSYSSLTLLVGTYLGVLFGNV